MPLLSGKAAKGAKGVSENIRREINAGKDPKQSAAIAYSQAKETKKEGRLPPKQKKTHKETLKGILVNKQP
jgi:hypothetical protein